jgi:hypothetical protein
LALIGIDAACQGSIQPGWGFLRRANRVTDGRKK